MSYEPQAGGLAAQVIGFLRHHPEEHLTLDDISVKFNSGTSNIHTLLARALDAELLKRAKNKDADWIYSAGPALQPVKDKPAEVAKPRAGETDLDSLVICNDPLPTSRASPGAKYVPIFSQLKPGQCIKCKTEDVGRIGNAMRKWIEVNKLPYMHRVMRQYHTDGQGRVWLLDKAVEAPKLKRAA